MISLSLPNYKIKEQIYQGKHSIVFRAVREGSGLPVIIKTSTDKFPTAGQFNRLYREYEIGKEIDDEHVVKYNSIERYGHSLAIVEEDFGGESLADVANGERLDPVGFLKIAVQLVSGLIAIHRKDVIHKDIKPRNIVINRNTGLVKLIDFGLASQLSKEPQFAISPAGFEGTLAYMSPEQTGRMNRATDYRTDFYSLGITLYELLCGSRPFDSQDPMELIHCHIAKRVVPICDLRPEIPRAISDIVMKLLSKNAEDRYQSAYGVKVDLMECLKQLGTGQIDRFVIGRHDLPGQFQIHQRLYGRELETTMLMDAFDKVGSGSTPCQLMLVSGYSGIGKTALVKEIHKPLARQRGYFISGKFDQFKRNIPFASFIQAFQELIRIILTENREKIDSWKRRLLKALGENGQVVIDVIPEVAMIAGPQPPVLELGATENQNRFNRVFQNFIQVFSKKEHPLVIFLDDLQWADPSTLYLLKLLMTDPDSQYLFIIGAYRDNEVDDSHPLVKTIKSIEKRGFVGNLLLKPLKRAHVGDLIADSLKCASEHSFPLTELVYRKTRGNPFFVIMFLTMLYQEKLVTFDTGRGRWHWDLQIIESMEITDNVVDLMVGRIKTLPGDTQVLLSLAACIGNQFNLKILSVIHESPSVETAKVLWPALHQGLIVPLGEEYKLAEHGLIMPIEEKFSWIDHDPEEKKNIRFKFLHDRVQQAADSLIAEGDKPELHLKIGRLFLDNMPPEELEENIFEVVDHLNQGKILIASLHEKKRCAELNLNAARKAKLSSAYEHALKYAVAGMEYLPEESWERDYDLTLSYYLEKGETEYLNASWDESIATFDTAYGKAHDLLDRCTISKYKASLYRMKNDLRPALDTAVAALDELGIHLSAFPDEAEVLADIEHITRLIADMDDDHLFNLPELTDPLKIAAMGLLWECFAPAYFLGSRLISMVGTRMTEITVKEGNCPYSAVGYIFLSSITLANNLRDFDNAYKFGSLAIKLNERKYHNKTYEACILDMWGTFVCHHKESIPVAKDHLLKGYYSGIENGSYQWAGYCGMIHLMMSFWGPGTLLDVSDAIGKILPGLKKIDPNMAQYAYAVKATVYNLTTAVQDRNALSESVWPGVHDFLKISHEQNDVTTLLINATCMLSLANWFSDTQTALYHGKNGDKYAAGVPGVFFNPVFRFHQALAYASAYEASAPENRSEYLKAIEATLSDFDFFADHARENYQHQALLLRAELKRITGHVLEAMDLFDQAIGSARENGFLQNEALACELAGRFYLARNKERIAVLYLRESHYAYLRWGAVEKAAHMEEAYPQLHEATSGSLAPHDESSQSGGMSSDPGRSVLDFTTVMKATQAISSEINLERLMERIMAIMIENAGAQKGVLVLKTGDRFQIEAIVGAESGKVQLQHAASLAQTGEMSGKIVRYVVRTGESVVLPDDSSEAVFADDPYLAEKRPLSVLCTPIRHKNSITGALYLENNLTARAFTGAHIDVLRILLAQAAISMENARMYDRLEELVAERTKELETTHAQLVDTAHRAGMSEVASNVLHNVGNVLNSANVTATLIQEELARSRLSSLSNVVDLLNHNSQDLGRFFTTDEKGKKLPLYMEKLAEQLAGEKNTFQKRVGKLLKDMAYIKDIARLQQSYVGGVRLEESLSLADIVDDAVQLYSTTLAGNGIRVLRRYEDVPAVKINKHKLMLILANLLSNARDAVMEREGEDGKREISLSIERYGESHVRIIVADNGSGIDNETLKRIFQHGFTTKKWGHGFGLHSSANAAEDLDAKLRVHSDGPGQGASFTLEIPIVPA